MIVEENILNGQQLINLRLKETRELPVIGQKEFQPSNSWLEKKQIQNALAERKALLQEQRVEKSNALSCAEWISDVKKAKVTKKVGKLWENYGHHTDDADWLFPEEALLLLETNALELFLNEIPLSIERGYVILLNKETGCTLNEYRVYSHLARLGYRLFRHLSEISVTRYEKEINLDQHVLKQKKTYSANKNTDPCLNVNDIADRYNDTVNADCDILTVTSNATNSFTVESSVEKQVADEVPILQDQYQNRETAIEEVVQVEPDEPVISSDVALGFSKTPTNKSDAILIREDICIIDDDDDVVEIPIDKEIVVVNDVSSSSSDEDDDNEESSGDSENEEEDDDSVVSRRSNSNWKRQSNVCDNVIDVSESPPAPSYAIRTNYMTVNEFLYDPSQLDLNKSNEKDVDVIELSDDESTTRPHGNLGKEIERFYKEIEVINVDSEPEDLNESATCNSIDVDFTKLSKKDIFDLFPNLKNGIINIVKVPPSNLLPPNIKPSCKEYKLTFSTSDSIDDSNTRNRNNFNNYCNGNTHRYFTRSSAGVEGGRDLSSSRNRQYDFQRGHNRSSFYYNQNRSRFSDVNPFWCGNSPPWHMNTIQNQVSQLRDMATGMMQVASSLLTLPFVQQSLSNIPSLLGPFQQSASRMPALYDSNQHYQNQLFYGPRLNNFGNSHHYGGSSSSSSLINQPNNLVMYNSSVRQQYNAASHNYLNVGNSNYNYDSTFQRQNYNQHVNNNFVPTYNEQNVHNISQQSVMANFTSRDNSYSNSQQQQPQHLPQQLPQRLQQQRFPQQQQVQSMKRSRPTFDNYSQNIADQRDVTERNNENVRDDNVAIVPQNKDVSENESRDGSFGNKNQDQLNDSDRANARQRRRAKRRQLIDYSDCSVFTEDIAVTEAAFNTDSNVNNQDFIPFSDHNDRNHNDKSYNDHNRDHPNRNNHFMDRTDFDLMNDLNYVDFNKRYDNRIRGYNPNNRARRPWYNRNRRPNWRSNQNTPPKRQRFHNDLRNNFSDLQGSSFESRNVSDEQRNTTEESRSMSNERRNMSNESWNTSSHSRDKVNELRNDLNEPRNSPLNDSIEIIEDVVGNETARNIIISGKRIRNRRRRKRLDSNRGGRWEMVKSRNRGRTKNVNLGSTNIARPIEVIDIDFDEPLAAVKTENNVNKPTNIKAEKSNDNQIANKEINNRSNTSVIKRESLEDETSVNSVFSNSCISTNSTSSCCIVKSEPSTINVKEESTVVKQETSSVAITTSVSSVTSATETTVMTTTTATVISVKLEENVSVKTEKSKETDKDSSVTVAENLTNEIASIKTEKASEVDQPVKLEKDVGSVPSTEIGVPITEVKTEISTSGREEVMVTQENNEGISASDKIVNDDDDNVPLITREQDKEINVPSNSTENVAVNRSDSTEASQSVSVQKEVSSWAQLKQQSSVSVVVTSPVELMDEDEESDEEVEEDDEEQIRPIITAKDCKSIGTVLSALQIIGTADLSNSALRKFEISFDVYVPNIPLKKSSRGLPNYRLVVMSFRDDVPTPGEMAELSSRFQDGVPILIAVVSPDSVSFFAASTVKLPTDDGS